MEELEFRRLEHFALSKVLQDENTVISCGGGVVENEDNYSLLKTQDYCIWLDANATYCFNQIEKDNKNIIIIYKINLNEGLIGIIAARLKEYFNKYKQGLPLLFFNYIFYDFFYITRSIYSNRILFSFNHLN
jgi:shikimate kinase